MAGPKNAFYTKINQVRPSEKPIMSKNGPISSIMINERGDLIALTKGTVKTAGNRNLIWNNKDASLKFVTSDGQKVIFDPEFGGGPPELTLILAYLLI